MKYHFDAKAAQRAEMFFKRYLTHVKGAWSGNAFELEKWQSGIVRDLFGGLRRGDQRQIQRESDDRNADEQNHVRQDRQTSAPLDH